jgi:hypothetical protein
MRRCLLASSSSASSKTRGTRPSTPSLDGKLYARCIYPGADQRRGTWAGILAATWILAFVIAEVIPFFSDLLALMSALFDSFFGWIFWGTAYLRMRRADLGPGFWKKRGIRGYVGFVVNIFIILVGIYFLGPGTYVGPHTKYVVRRAILKRPCRCQSSLSSTATRQEALDQSSTAEIHQSEGMSPSMCISWPALMGNGHQQIVAGICSRSHRLVAVQTEIPGVAGTSWRWRGTTRVRCNAHCGINSTYTKTYRVHGTLILLRINCHPEVSNARARSYPRKTTS